MSNTTIFHEYLPGVKVLDQMITEKFGEGLMGTPSTGSAHVIMALAVTLFILYLVFRYSYIRGKAGENSFIPEDRFNARSVVEIICDASLGLMEGIMGKEIARAFFPFIGTMAFFILLSNLAGLIPGFLPPTDVISTNVGMALIVFLATHYYGVKTNGFEHFKHMMGPILILAPLIFVIELISHVARPLSLTLRLFGNMVGDHKVLSVFLGFGILLVPLPAMMLGFIVCVVQALVFCLLSTVYISMALEDLHEHH